MNGIYKFKNRQPVVWFHKQIEKSNQWCLYCGEYFGASESVSSNKEHLIAREFVPSGSMGDTCFNFIFRACTFCNSKKAELERHVSSVSLYNSPGREASERINKLAINKASKDFHPDYKGRPVLETFKNTNISINNFMTFGLTAPPQLNREYVKDLAMYHIQGLFSLVTTTDPTYADETRLLSPNQIQFYNSFNAGDWGNPQLLAIIDRTKNWPCYCNVETADGYFKAVLRCSLDDNEGWFWALEWNKYLRVVGGIYNENQVQGIFDGLPELEWKDISLGNSYRRIRKEAPLNAGGDELFDAEVVQNKHT